MDGKNVGNTHARAAAADLVPLARAIFGCLHRLRLAGFLPPPTEARVFFLYAACKGVSRFLESGLPAALPERMRVAADELAPEIARALQALVATEPPPVRE